MALWRTVTKWCSCRSKVRNGGTNLTRWRNRNTVSILHHTVPKLTKMQGKCQEDAVDRDWQCVNALGLLLLLNTVRMIMNQLYQMTQNGGPWRHMVFVLVWSWSFSFQRITDWRIKLMVKMEQNIDSSVVMCTCRFVCTEFAVLT